MNEAVIPVLEQHHIADEALRLALEMNIPITRAIARSFVVTPEGEYVRTANRHDAVLPIKSKTLIDVLREHRVWTVAVGKTSDVVNVPYCEKIKLTEAIWLEPELNPFEIVISDFGHRAFKLAKDIRLDPVQDLRLPRSAQKDTNPFVAQGIVNALHAARVVYRPKGTFVFANFVDTDSLYGHTRDIAGAIHSLEEFDRVLPLIEQELADGDLLIITADHGMEHRFDYGYHSKEPLPVLARRIGSASLELETGTGEGLTEIGMLVTQFFNCEHEFRENITRV